MANGINEIEAQWTNKGFNDRFDQIMVEHQEDDHFSYMRGYEQAEEEHVILFGKLRYSSYQSFRESRRQMLFPK